MSKIQSIFGDYASNLQAVVDRNRDRFGTFWYPKYFSMAPAQQTLNFSEAIGESRIQAAASIVDRDSSTPLRSRDKLKKLEGEVPAIKEALKMKESDYRDFMTLQNMNVDDATKLSQLLDFLFGDVQIVGNSAHKRL